MDQASMKDVPKNMRRMGMLLFQGAFMEAIRGDSLLCVVHAAHAAEILLKARIAQEHPLLIFSQLPKADPQKDTLTLDDLIERGQTLSYIDLPERLWATTGIKIEQIKITQYLAFGKLRNQIVHFSTPSAKNAVRLDELTLRYSLEVLDPLVESFWGKSVIDFITKDPGYDELVSSGIFEDSIREKGFSIDQRLRRLLGDASREAWESMKAHHEEMNRLNRSKTNKEWEDEAEFETKRQTDRFNNDPYMNNDPYKHQMEANWKLFLDAF
jgi:hypothetical protein